MLLYRALTSKAKETSDRAWIENILKVYQQFVYSYVLAPYACLKAQLSLNRSSAGNYPR